MIDLKETRKTKGFTLEELEIRTGYSGAYLSQIENRKKRPSRWVLDKLSNALDIPFEELMKSYDYDHRFASADEKEIILQLQRENDTLKRRLKKIHGLSII